MAKSTKFSKAEFDALMNSIQEYGKKSEFFPTNIRDSLEKVKKIFENFHRSQEMNGEAQKMSHKRRKPNSSGTHLAASRALWKICKDYMEEEALENSQFEDTFIALGIEGYKKFRLQVQTAVLTAVQEVLDEEHIDAVQQQDVRTHYTKKDGWVDMALMELPKFAMDNVVNHVDKMVAHAKSSDPLINRWGLGTKKRNILQKWSQYLKDVRCGSSVRVMGETNDGLAIIQQYSTKKKEIRPSRIAGGQKQLLFIEKDQIIRSKRLGKSSYGTVNLCTLQNISYIPSGTQCCIKTWIEKKKEKNDLDNRRKSAIHEAILGGLNHTGIVSAFAMTTADPPELIYDYYNGGTLRNMMKRVRKSGWPFFGDSFVGKEKRERAEINLFMRSRLQICFAILEALEFFHSHGRLHNDLHSDNILLHFKYDVEGQDEAIPLRIFVAICDFGRSTYESQTKTDPTMRMWAMNEEDVQEFMKDFPQMALEIVSTNPGPYTQATDIWALGNLFEIVLLNKGWWARENIQKRSLCPGWEASVMQPKLEKLIGTMKEKSPERREDCSFHGRWMYDFFRHAGIKRINVEFFRE